MSTAYLKLSEVAAQIPPCRGDKRVHPTTVTRWITHGVKITGGKRVMLRGVRLPSGWRTTQAWVDEFLATLTRASIDEATRPKEEPEPVYDPIRKFEIEQAMRDLKAMGV